MIFTFVILTYKNFSDTVECIDSILSNITYKNNIVVVDNHSNDSTFSKIRDKYKNYKQIYYLETNNNLGFAKGNNVGFLFAKNNLHSDFICLLNNDTLIYQKNFIDICINDYKQHNYFVLGPSITCTVDNSEQNPHGLAIPTKTSIIKLILKNSFLLLLTYIPSLYEKLKSNENSKTNNKTINKNIVFSENVNLNGCCLIFSPLYIKKKDGLFSKTFMYCEEEILFYQCIKENMKTIFDPKIKIFHKEGCSTNSVLNNDAFKKRRFYYKNTIYSSIQLLKLMF